MLRSEEPGERSVRRTQGRGAAAQRAEDERSAGRCQAARGAAAQGAEGERGPARTTLGTALALLGALALGLALRLAKLPGTSLGYDGLQSVTHAARGLPTGLLSAFLHDPHPPLYYALLALWLRLGTSDAAVLGLSVALSLLTVVSVHHVARVRYGTRVAGAAALVCALHPLALYWSLHARMYPLVMCLSVWAFHFGARLAEGSRRRSDAVAAVASGLALLYSHVAAPFFLASTYAAVAPQLAANRAARRRWLAAQAIVALGALPYLFFPATTAQEHMKRPALADLARALALFTSGVDPSPSWLVPVGAAAFAGVAGLLLRRRGDRAFALAFLVLPFAAAAAASHWLRPIWYGPRLFAFLVPFFAIALARELVGDGGESRDSGEGRESHDAGDRTESRDAADGRGSRVTRADGARTAPRRSGVVLLERTAALAALALVAHGAVATLLAPTREERFADAAALLRAEGRPGELVVVPTLKDKWALAWYSAGPDWARGAVRGDGWSTLRRVAHGSDRRALLAELAAYGRDASGEPFGIVPATDLDPDVLSRARRVWIVARSPVAAEALRARLGAKTVRTARAQGLAILLVEGPGAPAATRGLVSN